MNPTKLNPRDLELLAAIRENQRKLDSCDSHDFCRPLDRLTKKMLPDSTPKVFCLWQCPKCGGYVDHTAKRWYEMGRKHSHPG